MIKKINNRVNKYIFLEISLNNILIILSFLGIILFLFLQYKGFFQPTNYTTADALSFLNYDFSSVKNSLSQFRAIGVPILIKIYQIFSKNLLYWSEINFFIFFLSCLTLFISLIKNKVKKITSFFFITGIILTTKIWPYFSGWSEIISISFQLITLSIFLFAIKYNKKSLFILFSFFIFFTILIRSDLIVIIIFYNIFFYLIFCNDIKKKISKLLGFTILTTAPLLIFVILRFFITGNIGITPYGGTHLASHAMFYLNDTENKNLNLKNSEMHLLEGLILRRKNHIYPCNQTIKDFADEKSKMEFHFKCYSHNTMSIMLEIAATDYDLTPFPKGNFRNYNSWNYTDLEGFFLKIGLYNAVDKKARDFAFKILSENKKDFFLWITYSFKKIYKMQFVINKYLIALYSILILFYLLIIFFKKNTKIKIIFFKESIVSKLLYSLIITNFISIILISILHTPLLRILIPHIFLFIPIIFANIFDLFDYNKYKKL